MKSKTPFSNYFIWLFLCLNYIVIAQENSTSKEKISNYINEYFILDRENIHLHLDKNIFFTDEEIWVKGYIFSRNTYVPSFLTTNVFLVLLDENGNKLDLFFLNATNGSFSSNLKLKDTYTSGNYYIQAYTNWMNNFKEDESSVYKIKIVNTSNSNIKLVDAINYSKINVDFFPEGGNYINGVINSMGIKISDCNGRPIKTDNCVLKNSNGEVIKTITINKDGNGKFEINPLNESYKVAVNSNDYLLPEFTSQGLSLAVNHFIIPNKTIIKIRCNQDYFNTIKDKSFFIVLQQNEKSFSIAVDFSNQKLEQEVIFSNDYLFNGVNTIRLIDANLNLISERIIYKNPNSKGTFSVIQGKSTNSTIAFFGNTSYPNATISIAVLPANTIAANSTYDINESLFINPYLEDKISKTNTYTSNPSRSNDYDLDLLFLNQKKAKYAWSDIIKNPPKKNFEFDLGINIKGNINENLPNSRNYNVQLKSVFSEVVAQSDINEKNEFYLNNLIVTDSSQVYIDLIDKSNALQKEMKYYATITNGKRSFNKHFAPKAPICEDNSTTQDDLSYELPKFEKDVIYLDKVDITKKEENKLKRQKVDGNSYLRGVKITGTQYAGLYVLDFIEQNGFLVTKTDGIRITGRFKTSVNGPMTSPLVFLNDNRLLSFDQLIDVRMEELDEIYFSTTAIVSSINNNAGIIKLYTKGPDYSKVKNKSKPYIITGGYKRILPFINSDYISKSNKSFENFGLIYWIPNLLTDENGNYKFTFPNEGIKKVKLKIEGITNEGEIISEIKEVTIE